MNNQDYEQKKRECWEELCRANPSHNKSIFARKVFDFAFDRAYALGKQTEAITQEDVEKAAGKFVDEIRIPVSIPGIMVPFINGLAHDAYLQGAQDCLGKQEKDAEEQEILTCEKRKVLYRFRMAEACKIGNNPESDYWIGYSKAIQDLFGLEGEPYVTPNDADSVIQGWVARDNGGFISLFSYRPDRVTKDNLGYWGRDDGSDEIDLPKSSFPDLTWDSDPEEVEITLKRKKK